MKVLPSTSSRREPRARAMNNGRPPTALKARTGLSTPPGRIRSAREKRLRDFEMRMSALSGACYHEDTKGTKVHENLLGLLRVLRAFVMKDRLRNRARGLARVVRDDDVGAGAPNGRQRLEHRTPLVEPAVSCGRFQHRVLAAHVIGRGRVPERLLHARNHV